MKNIRLLLLTLGLGALLLACEPLAPQTAQQVIVVTNTPTFALLPSSTALLVNNIPSPTPQPSLAPSATVIATPTLPPCTQENGRLFESAFNSAITDGLVPYNLYLPPCFFESGRRFPLLILLHGSGYIYRQWGELGLAAEMDAGLAEERYAPMVIAMPEGGLLQENNTFEPGASLEDLILSELVPHLEERLCLQAGQRAIGGISRGGFWAFSMALRNPDQFVSVGGHSPFFVPDNAPTSHNPLALAAFAEGLEGVGMYLDNAQNDLGGANNLLIAATLQERGLQVEHVIHPTGDHSNDYWSEHVPDYLSFYSAPWARRLEDLPTCQS
ncbi:MAG: hypothetical protein HC915_06200 [Anaerolineae bacterium]|nr:hypothetical protein [Anaerolineae bacterium]